MTEFSPFSCPIFLGATQKRVGCCFQSERLLYGREPNGVRVEPGKQKTESWTQELVPSSAQNHYKENEWQKRGSFSGLSNGPGSTKRRLFVLQRDYRIKAQGAACRLKTGTHCYAKEK